MSKMRYIVLLVCSLCFWISAPANINQTIQSKINQFLKTQQQAEKFSAVQVAMIFPGQHQIKTYVAGTADLNGKKPLTSQSLFQWGSVTKSFTTAIILNLQAQGLLKLTDTLDDIFPEQFASGAWPKSWQNVEIAQLLNMTSGIPGYGNNNEAFWTKSEYQKTWTSSQLVAVAANLQKKKGCVKQIGCFPAGSNWNYSNTNYVIASMIAAKLKHVPFSQQMSQLIAPDVSQQQLIDYPVPRMPLEIKQDMVQGYHHGSENLGQDIVDYSLSAPAASGALVGNMQGMAALVFNLFNGKIVSPQNTQLLKTQYYVYARGDEAGRPVHDVAAQCFQKECYGLGVVTRYDDKNLGLLWTYTGEYLGYRAEYVYSDHYKALVAVAVNSDATNDTHSTNHLNALAVALLKISCGK